MTRTKFVRGAVAVAGCAIVCTAAMAQDYTTTELTGQLRARPTGAVALSVTSSRSVPASAQTTVVQLPFTFRYYGDETTEVTVGPAPYLLPRAVTELTDADNRLKYHGQHLSNRSFPFSQDGLGGAGSHNTDGIIAAMWGGFYVNDGSHTGRAWTWVDGTAPDRVFVVSWEDVEAQIYSGTPSPVTIQIHIHESTHRIVFAFDPDGTYFEGSSGYYCGIDSPIDTRYVCPTGALVDNAKPPADYALDPHVATVAGTVSYDRVLSGETGIGGAGTGGVPLDGLTAELRRPVDGFVYSVAEVGANGEFSLPHVGAPVLGSAELAFVARGRAAEVVRSEGGAASSWVTSDPIELSVDVATGPLNLGPDDDPDGEIRAAFEIARTCAAAFDFATARTADTIPRLDVVYDPASVAPTSYRRAAGTTPALLTVASLSASNPDAWDGAVVTRTYARHILASVAGSSASAFDDRFDAVTDASNAFAAAFGHALLSEMTQSPLETDGTGPDTGIVLGKENPVFTAAQGTSHAGRVAAVLHDLVDAANESGDLVDGTAGDAGRWFAAADAMTSPVTFDAFLDAWAAKGGDAAALTRAAIACGAYADDDREANDDASEASPVGTPGRLVRGLLLRRYNEDWFAVTIPAPVSSLVAGMGFGPDDSGHLEIRSTAGALLATGARAEGSNRVVGATAAFGPGTLHVRVRNTDARTVPDWTLQIFAPLFVPPQPFRDWTEGRPYDEAMGIADGIPPYSMTLASGTMPDGIYPNMEAGHGVGTPVRAGEYTFTVRVTDSAEPANQLFRTVNVRIAPPLDLDEAPLVAFPAARASSVPVPTTGGTAPFAVQIPGGDLPDGLSIGGNPLRLSGSTATPGSTTATCTLTDVAGSSDTADLVVVVCPQAQPAPSPVALAGGDAACGVWVDAVQGSTLRFSAGTARKSPKRALSVLVLGPAQTPVEGGKVRTKVGAASGTGIPCPASGRYFVVCSSAEGDATTLLLSASAAPPAKMKPVKVTGFGADSELDVAIGALPGARLTFKATGDRKAGLVPLCTGLIAPDGSFVSVEGILRPGATGFVLDTVLPSGGTWTVRVAGNEQAAVAGKLTWSWTLRTPKGASWSSD